MRFLRPEEGRAESEVETGAAAESREEPLAKHSTEEQTGTNRKLTGPPAHEGQRAGHAETSTDAAALDELAASDAAALAELTVARAELKRAAAELADLKDRLARRQADFENYRKRTERERGETYNHVVADVAAKLLPVLDNMARAVDAERSLEAGESEEFRHFLHGVELIHKQLNEVLESLGIKPISAMGERFDPHVHEAVATEPSEDHEPDTVVEEMARGYVLGNKLLRPAKVKVATRGSVNLD